MLESAVQSVGDAGRALHQAGQAFEQADAETVFGQLGRGRRPEYATADDRDPHCHPLRFTTNKDWHQHWHEASSLFTDWSYTLRDRVAALSFALLGLVCSCVWRDAGT